MSELNETYDVVIVGGGLVGLSLAAALAGSRLSVAIIDAKAKPQVAVTQEAVGEGATLDSGLDARISAINPASHDFLARLGSWPGNPVCAFTRISVWDARGSATIEFYADNAKESALGYIVPNNTLLSSLCQSADAATNLTQYWAAAIAGISEGADGYSLKLADRSIDCNLLVGADGGHSIVRQACNMKSVSWSYEQDALVANVLLDKPHNNTACQTFTAHGPLAFLPLATPAGDLCSIVWSSDRKDQLMALSDEAFCEALTLASEGMSGRVLATDSRYCFPLRQQHAIRYGRAHLVLIGDAAHTIHPLAGQGANLGLADAKVLAQLLNDCRITGEAPGSVSLINRYQRQRQPQNVLMALVMEGFKRLYTPGHPFINWIRNAGTRVVDGTPALKTLVMRLAAGR